MSRKKGFTITSVEPKGARCNKSANKIHKDFTKILDSFQVDPKYNETVKEVMLYTYDNLTKELRTEHAQLKKQLKEIEEKIDAIEERFAVGEIDTEIYQKFKSKYTANQKQISTTLSQSAISSSNLTKAIDVALKLATNISDIWTLGDLKQKKRIQRLVFPSGIGYDKQNDAVRTLKTNSLFSLISIAQRELLKTKNGKSIQMNQFSVRVSPEGFEPSTASLEGRCSIQLS